MSRVQKIKSIQKLAWESPAASFLDSFKALGAAVVPGNAEFKEFIPHFKKSCNVILNNYIALAETHDGGLGLGKAKGFRELVHKDVGRYDLNLDHLIGVTDGTSKGRKLMKEEVDIAKCHAMIKNRIAPLLSMILGHQFVDNAFGAVVSQPGTPAQSWHVDSSHPFHMCEYPQPHELLPCHFTTIFFPLFEFSEKIGPTELALGSHKYTELLNNELVEDQYPTSGVVNDLLQQVGVERLLVDTSPGDIVIMDGRLLHRGLANRSNVSRTLMYLSFCRPWYREFPRSQNDDRSLFAST